MARYMKKMVATQYLSFDSSAACSGNVSSLDFSHIPECRLIYSTANFVKIQGYDVFHCLREDGLLGGGVTVFVRSDFQIVETPQCTISNETIETLFLRASINTCNFTLGTIFKTARV